MSQKYPTYKGLNLPEVADSVLKKWDAENVFEKFLKLSDEEKNNIDEESFNKLRRV